MKLGPDRVMPESACTACGHLMDRYMSVGSDNPPSPGSFIVCIRCGHLMAFGDDLKLRNLTDPEMKEIAGDPRVLAIQKARAAYPMERKP